MWAPESSCRIMGWVTFPAKWRRRCLWHTRFTQEMETIPFFVCLCLNAHVIPGVHCLFLLCLPVCLCFCLCLRVNQPFFENLAHFLWFAGKKAPSPLYINHTQLITHNSSIISDEELTLEMSALLNPHTVANFNTNSVDKTNCSCTTTTSPPPTPLDAAPLTVSLENNPNCSLNGSMQIRYLNFEVSENFTNSRWKFRNSLTTNNLHVLLITNRAEIIATLADQCWSGSWWHGLPWRYSIVDFLQDITWSILTGPIPIDPNELSM